MKSAWDYQKNASGWVLQKIFMYWIVDHFNNAKTLMVFGKEGLNY